MIRCLHLLLGYVIIYNYYVKEGEIFKMALYQEWTAWSDQERSEKEYNEFWNDYLQKEAKNYQYILENHDNVVKGTLKEVAQKFEMDMLTFCGFMDGINTSLKEAVKLEDLSEDYNINLDIDFEKLYYNMLDAKAHWLFNLPEWDGVLSKEKREEITKTFNKERTAVSTKVGRNEPCTCGSGKKYKKCCGA